MHNHYLERIIVSFWRADNQNILRMWAKSASDAVHPCSFQKNGYASGHVLRCGHCFPQLSAAANLSYPAGFSDKRRPQFLRSAYPQMGAAAAPIRGHASRCNSNAANRLKIPDSVCLFYSASLQMDVCLNRILLVVKWLLPVPDGEYPDGIVYCCNSSHVTEAHKRCGSTYSPRQSLPAFPLAGCLFESCNRCTLPGNPRCCELVEERPETAVCAVSFGRAC